MNSTSWKWNFWRCKKHVNSNIDVFKKRFIFWLLVFSKHNSFLSLFVCRSSLPDVLCNKDFLEISTKFKESTCAGVSLLVKFLAVVKRRFQLMTFPFVKFFSFSLLYLLFVLNSCFFTFFEKVIIFLFGLLVFSCQPDFKG